MFDDSPLIKTKYKIIKQLGEGSFGRVYLASSYQDKVNIIYKTFIQIFLVLSSYKSNGYSSNEGRQ